MNSLLTDEEFNWRLRKAQASDSTTAMDNIDTHILRKSNGLEMSRPASSWIVSQSLFAAAGRVGSIELLGGWGMA